MTVNVNEPNCISVMVSNWDILANYTTCSQIYGYFKKHKFWLCVQMPTAILGHKKETSTPPNIKIFLENISVYL